MKRFKKIALWSARILPALALIMGVISSKSVCISYYHQPKVPSEFNLYRR